MPNEGGELKEVVQWFDSSSIARVGRRQVARCGLTIEMARLEEEERGRGAGGHAWAERPSRAGWFYEKGARATRRMRAEM
jgi:hypothetical protein